MSLSAREFETLRRTIAARGTVRAVLLPVTIISWAALEAVLLMNAAPPLTALLPLAILIGGFEAIHALHVGVERIGRYLQVFYEDAPDGPRWESTAMAAGPTLPGGGIDPLFTVVFGTAVVINIVFGLRTSATLPAEVSLGIVHVTFLVRIVRARFAATRQRALDLQSFQAVRGRS